MVVFEVLMVVYIAYFAGASRMHALIASLLKSYCPLCGKRTDEFVRTIANILKGCIVVTVASFVGPVEAQFAALFVFIGHLYPVQRSFKGGNGMATLLGTMIALHPVLGLIALFSWLFLYFVFRYASVAAVFSAMATTTGCYYLRLDISMHLMFVFTVLVFWRHRKSLARVNQGTEEMVVWDEKTAP